MKLVVSNFINDESGATAVEYGLISLLVALGLVGSLTSLRDALQAAYVLAVPYLNYSDLERFCSPTRLPAGRARTASGPCADCQRAVRGRAMQALSRALRVV